MSNSQGYLIGAVGRKYIEEAHDVVRTLRKFEDLRPVSLIIEKTDADYAKSLCCFDELIFQDQNNELYTNCEAGFEKDCLHARLTLDTLSPYDKTVVLDSDVLCISETNNMWNALLNFDQAVQRIGTENDPHWHWGHVSEVSANFGKNVPHSHGGFTFVDKTKDVKPFFEFARKVFYDYDNLGCKRWFRGQKTEEIIIAIAFAQFDFKHHEFNESSIMTFDLSSDVEIPCYSQNSLGNRRVSKEPMTFVHMCHAKKGHPTYESIFNKIINLV